MASTMAAQSVEGRRTRRRRRGKQDDASPTGRVSRASAADAQRQCTVCRSRKDSTALLQLAAPADTATARCAYVCVQRACLQASGAKSQDTLQMFVALATRRLQETVGLARRAGAIVLGAARLGDYVQEQHQGAVVLLANDAAARTANKLGTLARPVPLTCEVLGAAAGTRAVAAVQIQPGRFAVQAAYWQHLWYECRPEPLGPCAQQDPCTDDELRWRDE